MGLPKCGRRRSLRDLAECSFAGIFFVITSILNRNENIGQLKSSQNTCADCVSDSLCHSGCESCRNVCTCVPCEHCSLATSQGTNFNANPSIHTKAAMLANNSFIADTRPKHCFTVKSLIEASSHRSVIYSGDKQSERTIVTWVGLSPGKQRLRTSEPVEKAGQSD